jgi:myosin-1
MTICEDLGLGSGEATSGKTKLFVKSPQSVFKLEELREEALNRICVTIQRVYRAFRARKWYLELRAATQGAERALDSRIPSAHS